MVPVTELHILLNNDYKNTVINNKTTWKYINYSY